MADVMEKPFDTTKPHYHQCTVCWKDAYCRGVNCEIPQRAECLECRRGNTCVEKFHWPEDFWKGNSGYRKTWPGRDSAQ